jgi:hypothetical protein
MAPSKIQLIFKKDIVRYERNGLNVKKNSFSSYFCFYLCLSSVYDPNIDIERKNRLIKVCYVPATSATFLAFFLAVAINNSNETCKAGGTCH